MSVRSEIIRLLDGIALLDRRNFADKAPEGETLPYTVVLDGISQAPALRGDTRTMAWRHLAQIDLWEAMAEESQADRDAVINALDGAHIAGSTVLYVTSAVRMVEPDHRLVHTAITVSTARRRA